MKQPIEEALINVIRDHIANTGIHPDELRVSYNDFLELQKNLGIRGVINISAVRVLPSSGGLDGSCCVYDTKYSGGLRYNIWPTMAQPPAMTQANKLAIIKANYSPEQIADWTQGQDFTKAPVCTCGSAKCGSNMHSNWCDIN